MDATAFEFATANRVVFGAGRSALVPEWLQQLGAQRVLLVSGKSLERTRSLMETLEARGLHVERLAIEGEPTLEQARAGAELCKARALDAVVAWGGGGAIDGGKAIAALATNPGDVLDYLEVIGRAQPLPNAPLPFVAVPTTAGTGSEVTRNAVLGSKQHGVKASLRSAQMLPKLAIIDPELLRSVPTAVLRASGLDAFSQLIEPFVSLRANPLSDALARAGIARSKRSLGAAVLGEASDTNREDLALASLFGGLCLANAGLGAVHGFAAPIGGSFDAPHGAVCAALLPHVMASNVRALAQRDARGPALARYAELGVLLAERADAEAGVAWVAQLCRELQVPGLASYGIAQRDVEELVIKAERASSMKGNPIVLTRDELTQILEQAL